jgi:hypothetical protein
MAIDEELHGIQFKSGLSHIFYGNVMWQGFLKTAVRMFFTMKKKSLLFNYLQT